MDVQEKASFVSFVETNATYLIGSKFPVMHLGAFTPQTQLAQIGDLMNKNINKNHI